MIKIAITGENDYPSKRKIMQFMKKLKDKYGPTVTVLSGGVTEPEKLAKKYALELGFTYKEYNPSFLGEKMYSAMPSDYYGKGQHYSHYFDRYRHMVTATEYLVIFQKKSKTLEPTLQYLIKEAEKKKVTTQIII